MEETTVSSAHAAEQHTSGRDLDDLIFQGESWLVSDR